MIYWDYDRITLGFKLQKGGTEPEWEFGQDAFGDFCWVFQNGVSECVHV